MHKNTPTDLAQDFLICPICLCLSLEAQSCVCCHKIFCSPCVLLLSDKKCPNCQSAPFKVMPNILAQRMVGSIGVDCPFGCTDKVTYDTLKDHKRSCERRKIGCQFCNFEAEKEEFLLHVKKDHQSQIFQFFDKELVKEKANKEKLKNQEEFDRIGIVMNDRNLKASIGENGKYYCKGELETKCHCCNGYCGPTNGDNCRACMKLDIKSRSLPLGYLVNSCGRICRKSTQGKFYCGALVLQGLIGCDGYCGPNDGPSCQSCQKMQAQALDRYAQLLQK